MNFDEIKRIWDSQGDGAKASLDEAAVEQRVRRHAVFAERLATWTELGLTFIFAVVGLIMLADAVADREPWHSYVTAAVTLCIAIFIYAGRQQRLTQDLGFDRSVLGVVERGIASVDHQIARVRSFFWWFLLPTAVTFAISISHSFDGRPLWVWFVQPLGVLVFWLALQRDLRRVLLPRKRELESLRAALVDPHSA